LPDRLEPTHTGVYPVTSKLVRDEWEKLRGERITPWDFFNSGKPIRVVDFYGKEHHFQGILFDGSTRIIFWSRYIDRKYSRSPV
jgi:hypothetical protein